MCPASEETLCLFAAWLQLRKIAAETIKKYLFAVQSLHVDEGLPKFWPLYPRLRRLIDGARNLGESTPSAPRDPVTPAMLSAFAHYAKTNPGPQSVLFWAAFSTAFFGLFRAGELTIANAVDFDPSRHFTVKDLTLPPPDEAGDVYARLRLKYSKTDPERKGVDVDLPHLDDIVCPHCALRELALARSASGPDAPLFAHVPSGAPLLKSEFSDALAAWLRASGFPSKAALPHSFRIGGATLAHESGLPDHAIQNLGRWASSAFQVYIRAAPTLVRRQRTALWAQRPRQV